MLPATLLLLCATALEARARTTTASSYDDDGFYSTTFSTLSSYSTNDFSGTKYTYISYDGSSSSVVSSSRNGSAVSSSSGSQITRSTSSISLTAIRGGTRTSTETATRTSTSAQPTNTVPCNGYPEFCERKYSNITEVCAHNSAFVVPNNAGSNQYYPILYQLEDGVRMLQGETHYVNNSIWNCHTSCSLLNAGKWQDSLETVATWLNDNPYDVVTWLIVNSDFVDVEKYVEPIQKSGLAQYLYEPEFIPQRRDQWPTLAEMILSGKRMVFFMDYNADQKKVPYILDEFTHIWETPFSPTNVSFPCTQQRPPGLKHEKAKDDFMYLANHNLNTAVDVSALLGGPADGKQVILIPNTAEINNTNGQLDKLGQLQTMQNQCEADWDRPPNFLLVDYYNFGDPHHGSVFEVAARANGVKYTSKCCGPKASGGSKTQSSLVALAAALIFAALLAW